MSESIQPRGPLLDQFDFLPARRMAPHPTRREWVRHGALFLLTTLTVMMAGIILAVDPTDVPEPWPMPPGWIDSALLLPAYYLHSVAALVVYVAAHPALVAQGAAFAAPLLAILLAHEVGHYVACQRYGVDATLPFFIPAPPLFLAGTFGAFIKIRSPIPSRRALFDIGIAGPLAGFAVIVPVAVAALLTAQPQQPPPLPPPGSGGVVIIFHDPLLLRLIGAALGLQDLHNLAPNSLYFAAWIGLLVTSLNLLPVGQLDGGHAIYALFGRSVHRAVSRVTFVTMAALAPLGLAWHGTPSGFVYALLLLVMLRVRHPQADDETTTVGRSRKAVALLVVAVFLLSFLPFPITIK